MKNLTLLMVGIVPAAVAMLSAGLSLTPVQQASANILEDGDEPIQASVFNKIKVTDVMALQAVVT